MSEAARPEPTSEGQIAVPTAADMVDIGHRLAESLRAGDLVVLSGDLGAGKTTLTRGIGAGLGVRGAVTSPTFVIARVHPSESDGPPLVHVDAYRLGSIAEVDDLDLDAAQADSVTIVEWGHGLVEDLAADRLEIDISRSKGLAPGAGPDRDEAPDEGRELRWQAVGPRWTGFRLDRPEGPPPAPA